MVSWNFDSLLKLAATLASSGLVSAFVTQRMTRKSNLDVESLKSQLEHSRSISKAQIEIELAVYRQLWEALSNFVVNLDSLIDLPRLIKKGTPEIANSSMSELVQHYYENLMEPHNKVAAAVQNNRPFFAEGIYEKADIFAKKASSVFGDLLMPSELEALSPEWWSVRSEWADEMRSRADEIARSLERGWQSGTMPNNPNLTSPVKIPNSSIRPLCA